MARTIICHIIGVVLLALASTELTSGQGNANVCTTQVQCSDCIQSGGSCGWCGDEDFKDLDKSKPRCNFANNLQSCKNLTFPLSSVTIPSNKNESLGKTVLINPQAIRLKLRPGRPSVFQLNVRPAEDYPVDLYYLMDLSASMADDLQELKDLGAGIANAIDKITKNYRLGFGSFVDKAVSPYIQIASNFQCPKPCEAPYGFVHSLSFTKQAQLFATEVNKLKTSGNIDNPEGGFDALMQAAICEKELDWKDPQTARKIIVYVSDASPHIAGDGKLGGIVSPNDYKCHLSSGGVPTYTESKTQDYPSVGLLKKILQEKKVVPILAVTSRVGNLYKGIVEEWKDLGATVGTLARDSSNVVQLIADAYKKISSTVTLNDNSKTFIQVDYATIACRDGSLNQCKGVAIGETVSFEISVTATAAACSDAAKNETNFQVRIPGFGDVDVEVEVLCECDCEKPPLAEENSDKCYSGNGTFACGQCNCNPGRFGDTCSCTTAESVDESLCRSNPNDTSEAVCSGLGTCICGKCECIKRQNPAEKITGRYCECTNFGCDRDNGKICGGPGHGRCECNRCICESVWIGSNCGTKNCTMVEPDCVKNGEICSGNGKCDCGICNCNEGYKGKHCEECPTCPGQCAKKQDCILCQAFQKGDPAVCANCSLNVIVVNRTIVEKCRFQDEDECFYVFTYGEDINGNFTYTVQQTKKCFPIIIEEPNVLAIVLGTIGGILLAGLIALLLWKLFVSAYDKYQYQQFEKERSKSNWQKAQNPLYKPSKQKYDNPAYTGDK